jgi:alkylmercury lyase
MTMTTPIDIADLAEHMGCCAEQRDDREQRAQLALYRQLAEGAPVAPPEFAGFLERWHGVHTDDDGNVIAFQGLSIVEAPHRLRVNGRRLYAWCAWDTLFLPELLAQPVEIESICPTTGERISLAVDVHGPTSVSPPGAVLTFRRPGAAFGDDVIETFCRFVHFFASREAAEPWIAGHPGTFAISIPEGFEIGRHTNAAQFGAALDRAA